MGEQQNILSGLVQTGTVTAIDSAKRKARVKFKDTGIISGWLYVLQHYGADFYIEPDAKHTHEITDTFTAGGSAGEYPAHDHLPGSHLTYWMPKVNDRVLACIADIQRGRYCVRRVLIMGMVGCLGDIVFTVSDRTIKTIDNVTWSGSARYGPPTSGTAHTPSRSSPALIPIRCLSTSYSPLTWASTPSRRS